MRRRRRFFSSCWSSSFIVISFLSGIDQKKVPRQTAKDHAFESVHVVEAIAGGFFDGGKQRVTGVIADHAEQLPQSKEEGLAAVPLKRGEIVGQLGSRLQNRGMLGGEDAALH